MAIENVLDHGPISADETGGDTLVADTGIDWHTLGHEIDTASLAVMEAYDRELGTAIDLTGMSDETRSDEIMPDDMSDVTGSGDARHRSADQVDYAVPVPERSVTAKPLIRPQAERVHREESKLVQIQPVESAATAVRESLNQRTLDEPDYYSTFRIAPQVDGGSGMVAMAKTYVERRKQAPENRSGKSTVWAYSHNGLDVRDFLASIDDQAKAREGSDPTADQLSAKRIAERTQVIVTCDSATKKHAIEDSGLLAKWDVKVQVIDPTRPDSFRIPEQTALALLPDTLDKLPVYKVAKGRTSHAILEVRRSTFIDADQSLLKVTPTTGQARSISPVSLRVSETAEGDEMYDLMPQLLGGMYQSDLQVLPLEDSDLGIQDRDVTEFMESQDTGLVERGVIFNYAEGLAALVTKVTDSVAEDGGLVYVSGYIRKDGDLLKSTQLDVGSGGPVESHIIEEATVKRAAESAVTGIGVQSVLETSGTHGYMLIDRSNSEHRRRMTVSQFTESVNSFLVDPELATAVATLNARRTELKGAEGVIERSLKAGKVNSAYDDFRAQYPQAARDAALLTDIARELNTAEEYEIAAEFGKLATAAAPNLSAGLVEQARAAMRTDSTQAFELAKQASKLSPRNPEVHKTLMDIWDLDSAFKERNLSHYVKAAGNYLRFAHGLETPEIIRTLHTISEAQVLDAELQAAKLEPEVFKTVFAEDLQTGRLRDISLMATQMKAMLAADTALQNAETVAQIMNASGSAYAQDLRAEQEYFLQIWKRLAPKERGSGYPLPRDEWSLENQDRHERWLHTGSILESDAVVEPQEDLFERLDAQAPIETEPVETPNGNGERRRRSLSKTSMSVGEKLADGSKVNFLKSSVGGHMLLTGISGMGKTTFYKKMFEQLPGMDINFWAFDMGDKGELETIVEHLRAKGVETVVVKPGDPDKVQLSIDILKPVEGCSIDAHIGQFVNAWITAYGGGGDSPIGEILLQALRDVYAVNGWPVVPAKGETLPESNVSEPVLPSLQELLDACIKYSSGYAKNTNAGNLPEYFKNRITPMLKLSGFSEFLVGNNHADMEKLMNSNVIFDFTNITNHDQRRFLFTALTMQAANYLQFKRGLQKETNMVWAVDEASLIAKDTGDSEVSRKQAVEMYADRQKVVRGYGVSIWNAMQSLDGIHPDIIKQTKTKVSFSVGDADKEPVLSSYGVLPADNQRPELFKRLSDNQPGIAIIKTDTIATTVVQISQPTKPTEAELRRVRALPPPKLPIIPNRYDHYTLRQHEEALINASKDKQAWKRIFIGATVMGHLAHTELPRKVPKALQRQWQKETSTDEGKRNNRLLLYYLAKQAVDERAPVIRKYYSPSELLESTVAFSTGMLNGEAAAQYASPSFSLPPIRQGERYQELTKPLFRAEPKSRQFAQPLQYRLRQPVEPEDTSRRRKRARAKLSSKFPEVRDQVQALKQHEWSPQNADIDHTDAITNTEDAFYGLLGNDRDGAVFWRAMRLVTRGELEQTRQRRMVAAALGFISSHYSPEMSEFERMLALPTYLRRELALAA